MQHSVKFFGNGTLESHFFLRYGMNELQHFGMQTQTVNRAGFVAVTILAVSDHRTAFRSEVYADLVRASGLQMELHEGINQLTIGRLTMYD